MKTKTVLLGAMLAAALPTMAADNKIRVADEGGLGDQWTLVPGTQLMPPYPETYAKNPEEVCLVIGYLVNADGHTSDFALLKSWASGSNSRGRTQFWSEFGDMASRATAQWRYAPKDAASAKPVYTAATFVFGDRASVDATRAHCAMPDLATRLVELRYDSRANRMMSHGIFGQLDIDPMLEETLRQRFAFQHENQDQKHHAEIEAAQRQQQRDSTPPPSNNSNK